MSDLLGKGIPTEPKVRTNLSKHDPQGPEHQGSLLNSSAGEAKSVQSNIYKGWNEIQKLTVVS